MALTSPYHQSAVPASKKRERYGLQWDIAYDDLRIELAMIKMGGGKLGLFEHFMRARALAWPDRYRHAWTDLVYHEIIQNIVTILMGPGSSGKTSGVVEWALLDYWAWPEETMVLITTVTLEKLDHAIYAELKMLFNSARARYPWLAGHPLESRRSITTDLLEEDQARDLRKGIVGKACTVGGKYVGGQGIWAGIKQKRIRFLPDELQFCPGILDILPNMFQSADLDANGEPDVKVVGSGNPKHDPNDQLSKAAEPLGGWNSLGTINKTTVWDIKFHRGRCVNLVGTDSPNFKVPEGARPPYPRLINRQTVNLVAKRWGTNSLQYYSQCIGTMQMGMMGNRILTKLVCEQHRAFEKAIWMDNKQTKIGFLDPAWGGIEADRCIWGWLEFGTLLEGIEAIRFGGYEEVLIDPGLMENGFKVDPDDQIARWVKNRAVFLGILPENIFYGSTGRGTTGAALARVFGSSVPVPIAEGDRPSSRPVRYDLFVLDDATGERRLKRCDEEYGRLNAELWFSVRNVVECDQMREMSEDAVSEFELREYVTNRNGKVELEKKEDTRERMGKSPDLADGLSFGVEGARQRGFIIKRLGWEIIEKEPDNDDFFEEEAKLYQEAIQSRLANHGARR